MKQVILISAIAALAIFFTGCLDTKPMNNNGEGSKNKTITGSNPLYDPDYYYELDIWGSNADVFEFTPRSNPSYTCISVGDKRFDCIPKPVLNETK